MLFYQVTKLFRLGLGFKNVGLGESRIYHSPPLIFCWSAAPGRSTNYRRCVHNLGRQWLQMDHALFLFPKREREKGIVKVCISIANKNGRKAWYYRQVPHQLKSMSLCPTCCQISLILRATTMAIPINSFVSHRPTDPPFFKVPFKENITDPYFWKFQSK